MSELLFTAGRPGYRVSVHVRPDRANRCYLQWPRTGRSATGTRGGYHKVASNEVWRATGRKELKERLGDLATQISAALQAGASLDTIKALARGEEPAAPAPVVAAAPLPVEPAPEPGPDPKALPLAEMFRLAIGASPRGVDPRKRNERMAFWRENPPPPGGIYGRWTQQAKTARQLADQIEDLLGADRDLRTITANVIGSLWKEGVADNAVKRVQVLQRLSRWAEREYLETHRYRRLLFEADWQSKVGEGARRATNRVVETKRFSVPEVGRLWRAVADPTSLVHPAIRHAMLIGGEQRLGQVLKSTVDSVARVQGAWLLKPPQERKKLTSWILIAPDHIELFASLYAAAQQRPDGRLFPLSKAPALKHWKKLEELAGVSAYGWYGVRRAMTDLCASAMTELVRDANDPLDLADALVLDTISAHKAKGQRDGRYRDSPVGDRRIPKQPSAVWDVLVAAMRVVRRAREVAIDRADSTL